MFPRVYLTSMYRRISTTQRRRNRERHDTSSLRSSNFSRPPRAICLALEFLFVLGTFRNFLHGSTWTRHTAYTLKELQTMERRLSDQHGESLTSSRHCYLHQYPGMRCLQRFRHIYSGSWNQRSYAQTMSLFESLATVLIQCMRLIKLSTASMKCGTMTAS